MKKNIRAGISRVLEFPQDVIMDLPKLTLSGNRELYLENYKGIIEYTDTTIRLNIGEKQLKIDGAQLGIKSIDSDDITVYGDIRAVEFI